MNPLFKLHHTAALALLCLCTVLHAQTPTPPTISGTAAVWYEGYGLMLKPGEPTTPFYNQRRPWNLVRFSLNPTVNLGKWSIPFNFNFSPMQNNFTVPSAGGLGGRQSFWQFLTNPMNSFGISPKKGSTQLLLGTQYIKYSDLSTGDLGIFGAGINLSPGRYRIKVFSGVSQRAVNFLGSPPPPGVVGAYQRNHTMAQLGLEKEGKYFVGFNLVHSKDNLNSVTVPPATIKPNENMVVSFVAKAATDKGWNYFAELGQSFHTRDQTALPWTTTSKNFSPFVKENSSTQRDNAILAGVSKKGKDWEVGTKFSYYGPGYYAAGYPFLQADRLEYLVNTKFNAFKKKTNVVASIGQRFGNWNYTSGPSRTSQIIANVNAFTQFNDRFSVNVGFNNFGFNSPSISGYKSVSNELSVNPTYTWSNTSMSHLISGTYTWSKFDETIVGSPTTSNNTQTALLMYVPVFFNKNISPDFSLMWFKNSSTLFDFTLFNVSAGLGWKLKKTFSLKSQLQYSSTVISLTPPKPSQSILASAGFDWGMTKKLGWQFTLTGNLYRFGDEKPGSTLTPAYAGYPSYLESTLRTGLKYKL